MRFFKMFRRKRQKLQPRQLRIDGVKTEMTAEPDDAELAAQALLEIMSEKRRRQPTVVSEPSDGKRDAAYYRRLAVRIRQAHDEARIRTMRFLSFCEQELQKDELPLTGDGSLGLMETELYKRLDIIERDGGDLKRRWQHCLAEVTLRMMDSKEKENEKG